MNGSPAASSGGTGGEDHPKVTPEIAAEAAVWIARLHGPSRTPQMEREFRAWQASSAAHREAFERCTDVWQDIPRIGLATAYAAAASRRQASAPFGKSWREAAWRWGTACVVAGAAAAAAVLVLNWRSENAFTTKVGEQRLVVLEDGSRMLLNTDTRIRVNFVASQRNVEVRNGEAFFDVAKDAHRPFVVHVAGSEVVAVGTAFGVRYAPSSHAGDELVVTLVEGQVKVRPAGQAVGAALAPDQPVLMKAGERLLLDRQARNPAAKVVASVDRPNVDHVMAWKRSEAFFEDAALPDAVAEMNRYNRTPIVLLDGLDQAGLRVSGLYRIGDSAGFASAIAALHRLKVVEEGGCLELTKPH